MTNQDAAAPVYCDSCGERTATGPACEDCRAERIANLTEVLAAGWTLSREQALWLLAEVGRLRDTLARRGEEYDAVRAERDGLREREGRRLTRTFDQMAADLAATTAERDRLAGQVQRVRDLRDLDMSGVDHDRLRVALNRLLDGGQS